MTTTINDHFKTYKYRKFIFFGINNIGLMTVLLLIFHQMGFTDIQADDGMVKIVLSKAILLICQLSLAIQILNLAFLLGYFFYNYFKNPDKLKG